MKKSVAPKPLFIPLKTEYYRAFERGEKDVEYRLNGPLWNEARCSVGYPVVLRRGYSTPDILHGVVSSFEAVPLRRISGGLLRISIRSCYPMATDETLIACIGIDLEPR